MFQTNSMVNEGDNLEMLQDFLSCLVDKNNSISGVSLYLIDNRVQAFLQIEDPLIIQKIVMMSF